MKESFQRVILDRLKKYEENFKQIKIIPPLKNKSNILKSVYDYIISSNDKNIEVVMIEPSECVCLKKLESFNYYIILTNICKHTNEEIVYDQFLDELLGNELEENNLLLDKIEEDSFEINEETIKCFNNIKDSNYLTFLTRRIAIARSAKDSLHFNIIFSCVNYQKLAEKLESFILKATKDIYQDKNDVVIIVKVLLEDVSLERLLIFQNTGTMILIDCPFLFPYDLNYKNVVVPLLTPFDIYIAFGFFKDGKYFPNKVFDYSFKLKEYSTTVLDLDIYERSIAIINRLCLEKSIITVPFTTEDGEGNECNDIEEGRKGIASSYNETKE